MSLALFDARCQGREGSFAGQPTLHTECVDCERRTDIPDGTTVNWMKPPAIKWSWERCASYRGPAEDGEDGE
jgi:hypothetical protein